MSPFGDIYASNGSRNASHSAGQPAMIAPRPTGNPLGVMPKPPQPEIQPQRPANPYGGILRGLATGMLGSEKVGALDQQADEQKKAKAKAALTWMQQTAAQPVEKRAAFTLQYAQDIADATGQPYERIVQRAQTPEEFSDEKVNQGIASLSAQLGEGPEKKTYQGVPLGNGGFGVFDPQSQDPTKAYQTLREPTADAVKPAAPPPLNNGMEWDGEKWVKNSAAIAAYREIHPQSPGGANGPVSYRNLSPDEVAARGYSKGTVVQVDSRGKEIPTARPTTQQTGQPTQSERQYAFYAKRAEHALGIINDMEGDPTLAAKGDPGFNRVASEEMMFPVPLGERGQKYDQAMREFIDGYLRIMTGAAATESEVNNYLKQWAPQAGDTLAVRQQKAEARNQAAADMQVAAGRGMPQASPQDAAPPPPHVTQSATGWTGNPLIAGAAPQARPRAQAQPPQSDDLHPDIANAIDQAFGPDDEDAADQQSGGSQTVSPGQHVWGPDGREFILNTDGSLVPVGQ